MAIMNQLDLVCVKTSEGVYLCRAPYCSGIEVKSEVIFKLHNDYSRKTGTVINVKTVNDVKNSIDGINFILNAYDEDLETMPKIIAKLKYDWLDYKEG